MIQSIYHFHSKEGINMNKIYKVIWSKAKHTYVVASEIAKGHTKGETTGRGLKKLAAAMLVAAALLSPSFAWAEGTVTVEPAGTGSTTTVEVYTKGGADSTFATKGSLTTEATERANVDSTLQTNIDNEATNRKAADTTLQSNIDTEATDRKNADKTIQQAVDAKANAADVYSKDVADDTFATKKSLAQETTDRETADMNLQKAVDAKANAADVYSKADADTTFATKTEVNTADTNLQKSIDEEARKRKYSVTNLENADQQLQTNIENEAATRESADSALDSRTSALEAKTGSLNRVAAANSTSINESMTLKDKQYSATLQVNGSGAQIGVVNNSKAGLANDGGTAYTEYRARTGVILSKATNDISSTSSNGQVVDSAGDTTGEYSQAATAKSTGTTFTYSNDGGKTSSSTTIKGNSVSTGTVSATAGITDETTKDGKSVIASQTVGQNLNALDERITNVKDYLEKQTSDTYVSKDDAAVQDGAIVKADKTIGENVTNLDAALAKETAARIGADKAQDAVIQQVNQNAANGIATLATAYNNEVASREAADNELNERITNEANAIHETTNQLQTNIDNEAAAREAKDNELNERITNEANAIHETTNKLQDDLNTETVAREAGDTALDTRITNVKEYLEKQTSDKYVSKDDAAVQDGAIVKAANTIGENVTNLDAALAKETADRLGADKAQDKVIQQVNQNMVDGFNTINKNVADGFTALNNADLKEAQERAAADTALDDKITAETSARVAADTKLVEAVNSGLSLSNDNVLQKNTTTIDAQGNVTTSKTDANEMILNKGKDNQITLNDKGIKVGTNSSVMDKDGVYTGGDTYSEAKAALKSDGQIKGANGKFTVDASGNTTVTSLDAGTGTIQTKGDLYAKDATFSGDITAKDATLSGDLSAKDGTFSGDLSAKDGTFSGDVSAKDVTATGTLQGAEVTDGTATLKQGKLTGVKDIETEALHVNGDANVTGKLTTKDLEVTGEFNANTLKSRLDENNYTEIHGGNVTSKNLKVDKGVTRTSESSFDENGREEYVTDNDSRATVKVGANEISQTLDDKGDNPEKAASRVLSQNTNNKYEITDSVVEGNQSNVENRTADTTDSQISFKDDSGKVLNKSYITQNLKKVLMGVEEGDNKTTIEQDANNITNTAKNGTIKNDAKDLVNTATGNMTNTVGGEMKTTVKGNVTEDYKANLSTKVGGDETHAVTGNQTTTVSGNRTVNVKGTETENFNALKTNVKTDQKTSVGGNQTNIVGGDQQNTVSGSKTETVKGSVTEKYGSQVTTVDGDQSTNIGGNQTTVVAKDQTNTVSGNKTETVKGAVNETYGSQSTTVNGNQSNTVKGTLTETVTGDVTEDYKANLSTKVGGNQTTTVTGDSSLSAKNITNKASEKITNQIGDGSAVKSEMTADGITNTAKGGTIYNKSKDILNEASGDILNFADGEIGNSATKITNLTGDNTVTSDTNGTTFENKAHSKAIEKGSVTKTTISGNTLETGKATMDYAEVMKDLGVRGNATVDGNTTLGKEGAETTLTVNSTSTFNKDVTMKENATVGKDLTVKGKSTLIDDVTMKSNATVEKNLTVSGQSTFNDKVTITNGGLAVTGGTTTDKLHVTSTSQFDGAATFKDIVTMEKDLNVGGNAKVDGDVTAKSFKVGDKTYINEKGINANNQVIRNVGQGNISEGSTDAVSGGQLYETNTRVSGLETRMGTVETRVDKLDNKIDKVGANAAAMANLHPLEFDEDSKWNIAAAVGSSGSETASAVGVFYRPNENVMVNASAAMGTGENMFGGGVSLRLGHGGNKAKEAQMKAAAAENKELRAKVDDLTARMDALLSVLNPNMSKDFPDVPENHWAYEAVSRLAGNGIVEGYEDGKYHGERQMTRYEMAEIIYNALSKGAKAEKKLVEEFRPELQAMAAQKKA